MHQGHFFYDSVRIRGRRFIPYRSQLPLTHTRVYSHYYTEVSLAEWE